MRGYVIVGQTLAAFLEIELEASIDKAKEVIVKGQKWYVCDIFGRTGVWSSPCLPFWVYNRVIRADDQFGGAGG